MRTTIGILSILYGCWLGYKIYKNHNAEGYEFYYTIRRVIAFISAFILGFILLSDIQIGN